MTTISDASSSSSSLLLTLPTEIILIILLESGLNSDNLLQLRLTCRHVHDIVTPLVFQSVYLYNDKLDTFPYHYAKHIKHMTGSSKDLHIIHYDIIHDRIKTVSVYVDDIEHSGVDDAIFWSDLSQFTQLEYLTLNLRFRIRTINIGSSSSLEETPPPLWPRLKKLDLTDSRAIGHIVNARFIEFVFRNAPNLETARVHLHTSNINWSQVHYFPPTLTKLYLPYSYDMGDRNLTAPELLHLLRSCPRLQVFDTGHTVEYEPLLLNYSCSSVKSFKCIVEEPEVNVWQPLFPNLEALVLDSYFDEYEYILRKPVVAWKGLKHLDLRGGEMPYSLIDIAAAFPNLISIGILLPADFQEDDDEHALSDVLTKFPVLKEIYNRHREKQMAQQFI